MYMSRQLLRSVAVAAMLLSSASLANAQSPTKLDPAKMVGAWPADMQVVAIRIGRPTDKIPENRKFYVDGLGLKVFGEFTDHEGFSGLFIGLPSLGAHLEFTSAKKGSPGAAPSKDNNLVLYMPDKGQIEKVASKMASMGFKAVQAENPYWNSAGAVTIPDPDGWNVILMPYLPAMMAKCCEAK
jgi:catechol 2,3-dioxygenase-like lactoylglutathione lyase family enzyme